MFSAIYCYLIQIWIYYRKINKSQQAFQLRIFNLRNKLEQGNLE